MRTIVTASLTGLVLVFTLAASASTAAPTSAVACVAAGHLCSDDSQCCSKNCAAVRTHKECQ